jgi:hypothetical protein
MTYRELAKVIINQFDEDQLDSDITLVNDVGEFFVAKLSFAAVGNSVLDDYHPYFEKIP